MGFGMRDDQPGHGLAPEELQGAPREPVVYRCEPCGVTLTVQPEATRTAWPYCECGEPLIPTLYPLSPGPTILDQPDVVDGRALLAALDDTEPPQALVDIFRDEPAYLREHKKAVEATNARGEEHRRTLDRCMTRLGHVIGAMEAGAMMDHGIEPIPADVISQALKAHANRLDDRKAAAKREERRRLWEATKGK